MKSPVLDLKATGLLRVIRAVNLSASHLEFALYLSKAKFKIARPYLIHSANFREEKRGKIVYRGRYYNIFVYQK